ncbi:S49 family peptidase [Patescibacteria group bacterium]|nr:S49 family peptidase [Patescibacteria group bacterium]MBU4512101.1 S49 family peptidase [Patescibacteria group bacterium]MCG2693116.1 S49 family peptidase [Candidatus Parcubacteria bacterium]
MFQLYNPQRDKKVLKKIVIAMIVVAAFIIIKDEISWQIGSYDDYLPGEEEWDEDMEEYDCNVAGIELHGFLSTYIVSADDEVDQEMYADQAASEIINLTLEELDKDEEIKAIVLEIDSYGGSAVAGEEVADALKRVEKPVVAVIRDGGASAAYWAASGADIIFASANSDVGSIGITMSYLDYAKSNQKEGFTYNQLSTGRFKDTGDPDKILTLEEKELLMRDVKIMHENFIKDVADNRGLDTEAVRQMADGSSMLGQMAWEKGLIDKIGGLYEVKEYLKEKIGEEVEVCWYESPR